MFWLSRLAVLLDSKEVTSIVFFDLDNFKQVNDRNGHAAGDACLGKVVDISAAVLKGKGALYRYGGDEFAALLPNFALKEATGTAERIRRNIDTGNVGGDVTVTASF